MSTWDEQIFTVDTNTDFLDELVDLDFEEIFEAVRDAVLLAAKQDENCVQHARNQRIAARWQLRHLHGDGHLSDGPAARPQHDHPPTESAFQSAVC